jgi:hypothetical protein
MTPVESHIEELNRPGKAHKNKGKVQQWRSLNYQEKPRGKEH